MTTSTPNILLTHSLKKQIFNFWPVKKFCCMVLGKKKFGHH